MVRINLIEPEPGGPCILKDKRYFPIYYFQKTKPGLMKLAWTLKSDPWPKSTIVGYKSGFGGRDLEALVPKGEES